MRWELTSLEKRIIVNSSRIALLIPCFNNQSGLNASLDQLPSEYPIDAVVVDDGSKVPLVTPTANAPHRFVLLRMEENKGITAALNYGLTWILQNDYQYIARLDAGDIALPNRFFDQVQFLELNPDYALVGGQVRFVDGSNNTVFRDDFPVSNEENQKELNCRNCFIHPAVMIRADAIRRLGLYSPQYDAAEDYELFLRIARSYKVANLSTTVVQCHVNPFGISMSKRRTQLWSRLRLIVRYFNPLSSKSYYGILKSLVLMITPNSIYCILKKGNQRL